MAESTMNNTKAVVNANQSSDQQEGTSVSSGTSDVRDERSGPIQGVWDNNGGSHNRGQQ